MIPVVGIPIYRRASGGALRPGGWGGGLRHDRLLRRARHTGDWLRHGRHVHRRLAFRWCATVFVPCYVKVPRLPPVILTLVYSRLMLMLGSYARVMEAELAGVAIQAPQLGMDACVACVSTCCSSLLRRALDSAPPPPCPPDPWWCRHCDGGCRRRVLPAQPRWALPRGAGVCRCRSGTRLLPEGRPTRHHRLGLIGLVVGWWLIWLLVGGWIDGWSCEDKRLP